MAGAAGRDDFRGRFIVERSFLRIIANVPNDRGRGWPGSRTRGTPPCDRSQNSDTITGPQQCRATMQRHQHTAGPNLLSVLLLFSFHPLHFHDEPQRTRERPGERESSHRSAEPERRRETERDASIRESRDLAGRLCLIALTRLDDRSFSLAPGEPRAFNFPARLRPTSVLARIEIVAAVRSRCSVASATGSVSLSSTRSAYSSRSVWIPCGGG